jgi:hypothetical protein
LNLLMASTKKKIAFILITLCILMTTIRLVSRLRYAYGRNEKSLIPILKVTHTSMRRYLNFTNSTSLISLQTPRRNHDVLIMDGRVLVNIAGRGVSSIEMFDLQTQDTWKIDDERLDLNHIIALNLESEIYIACGLVGGIVNAEVSSKFMYVFDWKNQSMRIGPRMRMGRGACAAVILKQVVMIRDKMIVDPRIKAMNRILPQSWSEDLICIIGGSIGTHDHGVIVRDVDCYSRRGQGWIMLTPLPIQLDHLMAHVITASHDASQLLERVMDEQSILHIRTTYSEDQSIIVVGGRTHNYRNDRTEIYRLSLITGKWTLVTVMNICKSAFASVFLQNRYVVSIGGISRCDKSKQPITRNQIEVCDIQEKTCIISITKLRTKRFATMATATADYVLVCGGTEYGLENLTDCEVISVNELLFPRQRA